MKPPAGPARAPRTPAPRKKVRLDLRRMAPKPDPEEALDAAQKSHFWRWFALVALLHVLVFAFVWWLYERTPAPKPPEQFISLLPPGSVVKGTAGAQQAHKLGPTTAASVAHHASPPPPAPHPAQPTPITPPPAAAVAPPKPIEPKPAPVKLIEKPEAHTPLADKTPPKPTKPKPPKVKVDLTKLEDAPGTAANKPAKPKHPKKPAVKATADDSDTPDHETAKPDSAGLSREQIAEKLGEKLDAAGVKNAHNSGVSGSANSHASPFADFYASIRDQVMSQWQSPNLSDESAVNPIVEIHVERDGRVPAERVHLTQSSGNPTYDDSAVAAAKSLGYLHEPLPDGCPPDIPITFKLTR